MFYKLKRHGKSTTSSILPLTVSAQTFWKNLVLFVKQRMSVLFISFTSCYLEQENT